MDDWKERLKAEYAQTKERYEKLKAYNTRQEVSHHIEPLKPIWIIWLERRGFNVY